MPVPEIDTECFPGFSGDLAISKTSFSPAIIWLPYEITRSVETQEYWVTTHKSSPGRSVLPSGITILPVMSRGGVLVKEAKTGSPRKFSQSLPQDSLGSGLSPSNLLSRTIAPSPGKVITFLRLPTKPFSTSKPVWAPPVLSSIAVAYPVVFRLSRSRPIAWSGACIQESIAADSLATGVRFVPLFAPSFV